jgi:hypothetical protein
LISIHIGLFDSWKENVLDHPSQVNYFSLLTLSFSFVSTSSFFFFLLLLQHIRSRFSSFAYLYDELSITGTLTDDRSWSYIIKERKSSCQKWFVRRCLPIEQMNVWIDSCSNRKIKHLKYLKEEKLSYEPTTVMMRIKRTNFNIQEWWKKNGERFCGRGYIE